MLHPLMFSGLLESSWGTELFLLLQIVFINIVLSGDNALMLGLITQGLKKQDKKRSLFRGMIGAAVMRVVFAFGLATLLDIPRVKIVGALLLFFIAAKLYKQFRQHEIVAKKHRSPTGWTHALWLIMITDISMSLDNMLAVASIAGNHWILLLIGIVISLVLMTTLAVWIGKLLERYRWIEWIGFALVVFLAFKMLLSSINELISIDYHSLLSRGGGIGGALLIVFLHRKHMTTFEHNEITSFLYAHAPFIISGLLLLIGVFLVYGQPLSVRLEVHRAVRFTALTCAFLLALEMASLEWVKHKVKIKKIG